MTVANTLAIECPLVATEDLLVSAAAITDDLAEQENHAADIQRYGEEFDIIKILRSLVDMCGCLPTRDLSEDVFVATFSRLSRTPGELEENREAVYAVSPKSHALFLEECMMDPLISAGYLNFLAVFGKYVTQEANVQMIHKLYDTPNIANLSTFVKTLAVHLGESSKREVQRFDGRYPICYYAASKDDLDGMIALMPKELSTLINPSLIDIACMRGARRVVEYLTPSMWTSTSMPMQCLVAAGHFDLAKSLLLGHPEIVSLPQTVATQDGFGTLEEFLVHSSCPEFLQVCYSAGLTFPAPPERPYPHVHAWDCGPVATAMSLCLPETVSALTKNSRALHVCMHIVLRVIMADRPEAYHTLVNYVAYTKSLPLVSANKVPFAAFAGSAMVLGFLLAQPNGIDALTTKFSFKAWTALYKEASINDPFNCQGAVKPTIPANKVGSLNILSLFILLNRPDCVRFLISKYYDRYDANDTVDLIDRTVTESIKRSYYEAIATYELSQDIINEGKKGFLNEDSVSNRSFLSELWNHSFEPALMASLNSTVTFPYRFDSVKDLIRCLRNTIVHHQEVLDLTDHRQFFNSQESVLQETGNCPDGQKGSYMQVEGNQPGCWCKKALSEEETTIYLKDKCESYISQCKKGNSYFHSCELAFQLSGCSADATKDLNPFCPDKPSKEYSKLCDTFFAKQGRSLNGEKAGSNKGRFIGSDCTDFTFIPVGDLTTIDRDCMCKGKDKRPECVEFNKYESTGEDDPNYKNCNENQEGAQSCVIESCSQFQCSQGEVRNHLQKCVCLKKLESSEPPESPNPKDGGDDQDSQNGGNNEQRKDQGKSDTEGGTDAQPAGEGTTDPDNGGEE
eukprot:gene2288-2595_t